MIVGWLTSPADPGLERRAVTTLPLLPRLLFRLVWWPVYRRRALRLDGTEAPTRVLR